MAQSTVIREAKCGKREVREIEGSGSSVQKPTSLNMKQKEAPQMQCKGHSRSSVLSRRASNFTARIYGRAALLNFTGKRDQNA